MICVLVCLFLTTMIEELLGELPVDKRHLFRRYEKTLNKISNTECSCAFNQTCINEGLLPKYTKFNVPLLLNSWLVR